MRFQQLIALLLQSNAKQCSSNMENDGGYCIDSRWYIQHVVHRKLCSIMCSSNWVEATIVHRNFPVGFCGPQAKVQKPKEVCQSSCAVAAFVLCSDCSSRKALWLHEGQPPTRSATGRHAALKSEPPSSLVCSVMPGGPCGSTCLGLPAMSCGHLLLTARYTCRPSSSN